MGGNRSGLLFAEGLVYDIGVEEGEAGPFEPGGVAFYLDLVLAVDPDVGFVEGFFANYFFDYAFEGYYALEVGY